jgi:signal transduction histidine kinase
MNEIAKQAALHWQAPEGLDGGRFAYRFTVTDNDGALRYASAEGLPESLPSAIRRGFVPMDIEVGAGVVGKALVEVYPGDPAGEAQARLAAAAMLAFALLCALNLAFLLALHGALVRPFRKLQSFAHSITAGRLDEPLPMDRGNIFGLFTQSFDVMRDSLLEARKSQAQAERAKKELVAALSHDVKTPVTSIRLIAELLQVEGQDPATSEKLKTIEMKADQIDRLMNDMMHSTLEELGELKVSLSSEDSGVLKGLFESADHLSKVRVGAIPVCLVDIDRARMEQAIGNIIANAYKYAGTRIDVDSRIQGGLLQVDVSDYGGGVAPEELELVTAKFFRGENAKASQKEGEGLGLYIAKLLMEKMGGGIEVFNRSDGFTARLLIRLSR